MISSIPGAAGRAAGRARTQQRKKRIGNPKISPPPPPPENPQCDQVNIQDAAASKGDGHRDPHRRRTGFRTRGDCRSRPVNGEARLPEVHDVPCGPTRLSGWLPCPLGSGSALLKFTADAVNGFLPLSFRENGMGSPVYPETGVPMYRSAMSHDDRLKELVGHN